MSNYAVWDLLCLFQHINEMVIVSYNKNKNYAVWDSDSSTLTVSLNSDDNCFSLFQLVESTYLWKLHDLYNNEAKACDGIHLVPVGDPIICVKPQQYAMHCDAIANEVKLVTT